MNECVQSLYGIERLLEKRELGPAQILPALNAFATDVEQSCRIVRALFVELHELSQMAATVDAGDSDVGLTRRGAEVAGDARRPRHELLSEAFELIAPVASRVGDELNALFRRRRRLGAAERLDLERATCRLGGELQAVRSAIEVVLEALAPRPALVSLRDLVGGSVHSRLTFVAKRFEVCVACADAPIDGCPRVLYALLERAIRHVYDAGVEQPLVLAQRHASGTTTLLVGDVPLGASRTVERHRFELGPALEVDDAVLDAVAEALGLSAGPDGERRMRIDLAAA
jgi:hypothetical protein